MLKKLLILSGVLLVIGLGVSYYMYNKSPEGIEMVKPDFTLTSDELFDEYDADETAGNAKFINKVIEVSGIIVSVEETPDGGKMLVLDATNSMLGGVNATLNREVALNEAFLHPGSSITLKGRCTGKLDAVVLTDCHPVEKVVE